MLRSWIVLALVGTLAGCNASGTNPFITNAGAAAGDGATDDDTTTDSGAPIDSNRNLLPGTENPTSTDQIFRREARSDDESGSGFAESVRYDGNRDRFFVDNLAFDGEGGYRRVTRPSGRNLGIGPFGVFENQAVAVDGLTSDDISQLEYRALYAVGPDRDTSIAIIRTGAYIDYGFGGYIYQRDGGVVLPESGQARYTGSNNYGGLRDFRGQGGLEYVSGDIEVRIDFNDFNEGAGVIGVVSNRRVFDLDQNDITSDILSAFGGGVTQLPVMRFVIEPGVLDSNGELTGGIESVNPIDGETFEEGNYYAVLSGDNADTITGVIVVTGEDPRDSDITFRETAGFFATR